MNKHRLSTVALVIAVLLSLARTMPVSAGKPPGSQAKWTLMVYMNGRQDRRGGHVEL